MNRVTVIVLALAILMVHSLGIHQTQAGDFAPSYERAHVAYRLARNLVHHGSATWQPGADPAESSYPSPLWIGICAVVERLYQSPILVTQAVGMLCALGTVVFLAQFSAQRLSGLVAPLLVAASGTAAAAAVSGTEAPLAMALATGAFLAYERGKPRLLGVLLGLLVLVRPEGALFAAALFVLELVDRPRLEGRPPLRRLLPVFAFVAGIVLALAVVRRLETGALLSRTTAAMLELERETCELGWHYVVSFFRSSGSAPLVLLPLLALPFGLASGTCRRSLVVSALWLGMVLVSGGDGLPMWNLLAPIVPLLFLSVQEVVTAAIDRWRALAPLAFALVGLAVTASFLVSKTPGNLGPVPLEGLQRRWMTPHPDLELAYQRQLGRQGLAAEIRETERLRSLGLFLRDRVKEPATILTFWPGAIGYLSRKQVFDVLGRASLAPGAERSESWRGAVRVDLVRVLERLPDYVVPVIEPVGVGWNPLEILRNWLRRYDVVGENEARLAELISAASRYELISVPVSAESQLEQDLPTPTYLLLRRRGLDLAPELEIELQGRRFAVHARHRGHQQVVDLFVWLTDRDGQRWTLRPTGEFVAGGQTVARVSLLLYSTGVRHVQLVAGEIPEGVDAVALSAQLHNPGTHGTSNLSAACPAVIAALE